MNWTYHTRLHWRPHSEVADLHCAEAPPIQVAPPVHFGGEPDQWTPEDLLLSAAESCLLMSTLFFVHKKKVDLAAYTSHSEAGMERKDGRLVFTQLTIHVDATVTSVDDIKGMEEAVRKAEEVCPVGSALCVPISVELDVAVASPDVSPAPA